MTKVSVIIPTYKRSERILVAIQSVLDQTYEPVEIIVVDDNGDNDFRKGTQEILKPYLDNKKIKYICHDSNQGGCAARNTGAFAAEGAYIAFLDDDDFYETTKLEKQIKFIETNTQFHACMCDMFRIDENNKSIISRENTARGTTLKETILDGNLFTSMLLIKKEVFVALEGFSEIPRFQDKYFHYKFLKNAYKLGILKESLLTLVEHQDNRISLTASNKVLRALNTLHDFEKENKALFHKKEWKKVLNKYFYNNAYILCQGNIKQRIQAIKYVLKLLPSYTNKKQLLKLAVKCMIPK